MAAAYSRSASPSSSPAGTVGEGHADDAHLPTGRTISVESTMERWRRIESVVTPPFDCAGPRRHRGGDQRPSFGLRLRMAGGAPLAPWQCGELPRFRDCEYDFGHPRQGLISYQVVQEFLNAPRFRSLTAIRSHRHQSHARLEWLTFYAGLDTLGERKI